MAARADERSETSQQALIVSLHPDAQRFAAWLPAHAEAVDWPWVLRTAQAHKVAALLAARLIGCGGIEALDPELRARVAALPEEAVQRAAVADHTLAVLAQAFGAAAVSFFVVKGSVLSHHIYRDPRLRRFADVDIVVRHADVTRAEAVLAGLGFRPGGVEEVLNVPHKLPHERVKAHALSRRFHARYLSAYSWYAPPGGALLAVDLHWRVTPTRLRLDEAELWAQTTPTHIGDTALLTFTPAATLIHLATHATALLLSGFRLMTLVDVGWAARALADCEADLWPLAERWRVRRHLAIVFDAVERVLDIKVPFARAPRSPGAAERAATATPLLLAAPSHKTWPLARRLWPELQWSVTMGNLRRNIPITAAVAWARLRFSLFRWRQAARR